MRKSEFKDTTMDFYATSRMVAKAEFSKVTSNTTAKAWEKAGHKLLKVKFMTVDIRSTEHPAPRRAIQNGLNTMHYKPATWKLRKYTTEKLMLSSLISESSTVVDMLKGFYDRLVEAVELDYNHKLEKPLVIEEMVTQEISSGKICVWKKQSFKDFDGDTVYRQVLIKIDGMPTDPMNPSEVLIVVDPMIEHVCQMKEEKRFRCAYTP